MENRNDRKSYYKGLLTGVILCVLIIGVLALSGCFLKDYAPSSTGQTTGTGNAVEASDVSSSSGDVTDISGRYKEVEKKLNKLHSVLDQYYLDVSDDSDITQDDMVEGIYKGYVDALNEPYTVYYTKEEYDQLQESTSGKYSGIGVVVSQNKETGVITVVRPFEGSPGAEAGILKDDILYKVADKEVTGVDVTEVVTWMEDLSKCAYRQMEIAGEQFDEKHLMKNGEGFWGFIDWTDGLNKQTAMQGVYIYCAKKVQKIAEILGDTEKAEELKKGAEEKTAAVRKYLLDEKTGLFVSGEEKQINYASQVWLILAGAVSIEEGRAMLDKLDELKPEKAMVSPYMNHHYVEALLMCGKKDQAMDYMKYYWGGMINHGADTFWELYNPENPAESPYGSSIVNSYCHAWSCTPTYLLRKYFN